MMVDREEPRRQCITIAAAEPDGTMGEILISFDRMHPSLAKLTHYAVTVRYPGESAAKRDAAEAMRLAEKICGEIRLSLGLEPARAKRRVKSAIGKP